MSSHFVCANHYVVIFQGSNFREVIGKAILFKAIDGEGFLTLLLCIAFYYVYYLNLHRDILNSEGD